MGINRSGFKTLDKLAMDPRVDEIWEEGKDGIWIALKPGYNWEGCICVHEWKVKDILDAFKSVQENDKCEKCGKVFECQSDGCYSCKPV